MADQQQRPGKLDQLFFQQLQRLAVPDRQLPVLGAGRDVAAIGRVLDRSEVALGRLHFTDALTALQVPTLQHAVPRADHRVRGIRIEGDVDTTTGFAPVEGEAFARCHVPDEQFTLVRDRDEPLVVVREGQRPDPVPVEPPRAGRAVRLLKHAHESSGPHIPEAQRTIVRSGREELRVVGDREGMDPVLVPFQGRDRLVASSVAQMDHGLPSRMGQP